MEWKAVFGASDADRLARTSSVALVFSLERAFLLFSSRVRSKQYGPQKKTFAKIVQLTKLIS